MTRILATLALTLFLTGCAGAFIDDGPPAFRAYGMSGQSGTSPG